MAPAEIEKLPVRMDTQGRVRATREQRRLILAEFERSGLSVPGFAQRAGLKYSTFAAWVRRYRRTKRPARRSPVRLLEAVVAPVPQGLSVQLPGGARLDIREVGQIPLAAALVRALEKAC
jgi:transposase-like protein